MTHPRGRHSFKSQITRRARHYVLKQAKHDPIIAEIICRTSRQQIISFLDEEDLQLSLLPDVEHGLVLSDSRGRGAFQYE